MKIGGKDVGRLTAQLRADVVQMTVGMQAFFYILLVVNLSLLLYLFFVVFAIDLVFGLLAVIATTKVSEYLQRP